MAPDIMHERPDANLDAESSSSEDLNDPAIDSWEDLEDDTVEESFTSLFDDEKFDNIVDMFNHCKDKYNFDIWKLQQQHELDFIGLVKLVNYIRSSVKLQNLTPDVSSKTIFDDDRYLIPVQESDAVLYNLEEILTQSKTSAQNQVEELQEQMNALQVRFDAYRHDVSKYLDDRLTDLPSNPSAIDDSSITASLHPSQVNGDHDYFMSYSSNAIHETMLKDKIRTDAYRDFIYDNKSVFEGKTVLDVGCGTGILSMFCARAGAKQVIAVDNSDIIHATREIIRDNKLDDRILCIKGKIEEVELPVAKVDIIVSEWMGYCLLYESMLDSVIHARDKYLAPGGLMVPSHASLEVGILSDSDIRESHVEFWHDVYGFDMRSMVARAREECLIRSIEDVEISGKGTTFRVLDLHSITVKDLDFEARFIAKSQPESKRLDGFVIWFDIFFQRSPEATSGNLTLDTAREQGIVAFSTGPFTQQTHWQQGICFTEPTREELVGKEISGRIGFQKASKDRRGLRVHIEWQMGETPTQKQSWLIL